MDTADADIDPSVGEQDLFGGTHYGTWIDSVFGSPQFPEIRAIVYALAAYIAGLGVAAVFGLVPLYVRTPASYIAVFGIGWVLAVYSRGVRKMHRIYVELQPCFLTSGDQYRERVRHWFEYLSRGRDNLLAAAVFVCLGLIGLTIALYDQQLASTYHLHSLQPVILDRAFYSANDRLGKFVIVAFWIILCGSLVGSTFRLLFVNLLFLLDLSNRFAILPAPSILKSRMREAANFYMYVAFTWSIGVLLFCIAFNSRWDLLSVTLVGTLLLLGLFSFFVPQWIFRRFLNGSHRIACDLSLIALTKQLGVGLTHFDPKLQGDGLAFQIADKISIGDLAGIVAATDKPGMWIYDLEDFGLLAILQALAVAPLILPPLINYIHTVVGAG